MILAAGASRRLGHPKQLVKRKHTTLLNHTIEQAQGSQVGNVFVALGSSFKEILPTLDNNIHTIFIHDWHEGMGQSIAESIEVIEKEKFDAIIVSVCDQPFISEKQFRDLKHAYECDDFSIVVSRYSDSKGPPTLFDKQHFEALKNLTGDDGAKEVVRNNKDNVTHIDFPEGDIDIDTKEDERRFGYDLE